jgi:hypothetical protein
MVSLPPKIFTIYQFFEKSKDNNWSDNPFKFYKTIYNSNVKIAKNISNLNFYQVDFIIDKKINPAFIIKYIRNVQYRNYFSSNVLTYKEISKINENNWTEEETYNGIKNIYNCSMSPYQLLFYTNNDYTQTSTSDAKYYNCYKILNDSKYYILRFETVYNFLDIDQNIDLTLYIKMIINLLKTVYDKFKIKLVIDENLSHSDTDSDKNKSKDNNEITTLESLLISDKK